MSNPPLRVGRIAYTNVAPIETAFDLGFVARNVTLTAGAPSLLNAMLSANELDVSPISAAHYLRNAREFELFGDCAIVARGHVISVLLVSSRPPALLDGATIAVTTESATARALLESVLSRRYGVCATYEPVADPVAAALQGRPTLLIGDAAISIYGRVASNSIHDLGTAWFDWTGLPMVFAVWAVRREIVHERRADLRRLMGAYREARSWGSLHRGAVIDAALAQRPRERDFYETYYATLKYALTADARRGLERFGAELENLETAHGAR